MVIDEGEGTMVKEVEDNGCNCNIAIFQLERI